MHKFIIVVCPNCGEIQATESRFRTKTCSKCGRRFEIFKAKVLASSDNAYEATKYTIRLKELRYKGSSK